MSELVSEPKVLNRWLVVVGATLIQLCLGVVYAWSVFTKKLTLPLAEGGDYGFSAAQTAWIFSASLASFALVMLFAGRWQAKIGPRKVTIIGGLVLGAAYILGGFFGSTFIAQFIFLGLVCGAGIGITYVVPIAVGVKWFPDKKGLITGLSVAGFGFGATAWVKLAGSWFGGLINTTSIFGLTGVQSVFVIYGVAFLVMVLAGSIVMINPPSGYRPKGWNPPEAGSGQAASGAVNLTAAQMCKTPQYWGLLLIFIGSAIAGLMVIYCIRLFGIDSLRVHIEGISVEEAGISAGTAMAWYAIFNGLGRIIWGMASDKLGRKLALFLMCLIQGIIMLLFFSMGGTKIGLIVGACIIGFNYGGIFALFPAATADFFGNKNVGSNYPWVFLAYGVAGIVGPQIAGIFKDAAQTSGLGVAAWKTPFVIAGIACLAAAALSLLLKAPKHENHVAA